MKWGLTILAVVAAGQLTIPAYMIHRQERTLREGRAYKFRTAPVDPYDAFRGRYVALRFQQDYAPWRDTNTLPDRGKAYAVLREGADGFAVVDELLSHPPASGDFLVVPFCYRGCGANTNKVYFSMPFNRYYMEETQAPRAERAYAEHSSRRGQTNNLTYVEVRVRNGHAALGELYIAGKPIRQFLAENAPPK